MIYSIFPSKDATLYERYETQNTGLDSVLEISNGLANDGTELKYNTRALVKFDLTEVSNSIVDGKITNPKFYLNLFVTDVNEIPLDYSIYAFAVSQSWDMGIGKSDDVPINTDGVSWKYRNGYKAGAGNIWSTASLATATTASWTTTPGGGTWFTGSGYEASESFSYQNADVRMDVTDIVNNWLNETMPNEGFIIKRPNSDESSTSVDGGNIKFFSRDTHTVYPPKMEIAWDDSSFSTGSLSEINDEQILIYTKNLKESYPSSSKAKIRIVGRSQFPTKTYATSSQALDIKFLPTSSYYSVRDARTDQTIIPFDDNYTKVSCDSTGNFIKLWTQGLQPERTYRLLFKVKREGGDIVDVYDQDIIFKISR